MAAKRRGRPTVLTAAMVEAIETLKAKGHPDAWCAKRFSVSRDTLRRWRDLGEQGDPEYSAFYAAYARGWLRRGERLLEIVSESAESGERGSSADARWLLEKERRDEFARAGPDVVIVQSPQLPDVAPKDAAKMLRAIRGGKAS